MSDLRALAERLEGALKRAWENHIDATGECWVWHGAGADHKGRGKVSVNGRPTLAHRAFWEVWIGPIPTGKMLCHHCDTPGCVRPDHIYIGTHADNMRDMKERRRYFAARDPIRCSAAGRKSGLANNWASGERNPKAKLTADMVSAIRSDPGSPRQVARRYGLHRTTVQRIRKGALWS